MWGTELDRLARGPLNFPAHHNGRLRCRVPGSRGRFRAEAAARWPVLAVSQRPAPSTARTGAAPRGRAPTAVRISRLSTTAAHGTAPERETAAVHPLLRAAADRQLGLFTALDARRAGYEHGEIRHLLAAGTWTRLRRGVYGLTDDVSSARASGRRHAIDCTAVLLDLGRPQATASHTSALRLLGLPARQALLPDAVRLTDPELWRRGKGFTVKQAPLPPGDVLRRGPLRLTTPARTLVDCAREWPLEDAVVAMDAALLRGAVTSADLMANVAAARSWPGAPRAARAAGLADGRAESPLETRGRLRIIGAGLPTPELQVEIRVAGQLVAVVDGWYEDAAVALEFDGRVKYTDPWRDRSPERVLWEEKRREDQLRGMDIRVMRLVDADLEAGWPAAQERLRTLLASSGPARRRFTTAVRSRGVVRAG